MRFFITKKVLVGVIVALSAILFWIFFTGCGSAGLRPPGAPNVHAGPANALAGLAVWATWIAGVGLLCCGIAAVFRPSLEIGKAALGCLAALVIAGILAWLAANLAVLVGLCIAVVVLSAVGYLYLHRKVIKKKTGVDVNWLCKPCKVGHP